MRPSSFTSTAELRVIEELLWLWEPVYPFLARFLLDLWGKRGGDFLEIGPFSGGVAREVLKDGAFRGAVLIPEGLLPLLEGALRREIEESRLLLKGGWPCALPFLDGSFDLVFSRGIFFFMEKAFFEEVWRVLAPGGMALLGGGYGPLTPSEVIEEIAQRSKELNRALGKRSQGPGEIEVLLQKAGITRFEILQQGGLWVLLRKEGEGRTPPLREVLGLGPKEVMALVGGGGKTTLMFSLATELSRAGKKVITTTTTKIRPPSPLQSPVVILEPEREKLLRAAEEALRKGGPVTVARGRAEEGKLRGVDPLVVEELSRIADYVLVEADGSKGRPIKVHREGEPVVPEATTLFIPVLGADGLGRPLEPQWVFRIEGAEEVLGIGRGDVVGPREILRLFQAPQGLLKGRPEGAKVVVFINKVDGPRELSLAREVKALLAGMGLRVCLGRVFFNRSLVEVG